jgi:hypothetical protein
LPQPSAGRHLPDPKSLNHALFGAWYEEDIYDQFCTRLPAAMRAFWWRIPPAMRARNLIFVHVPRVAGTSIVRTLYGEGCIHHHSMRYYRAIDPAFAQSAGSFVKTVDDYLAFLEGREALELDFVMRPQSWFVCDAVTGTPLVKDLFLLEEDAGALAAYLAPHKVGPIPWLNRAPRAAMLFNPRQRRRVERLYADDFSLIDSVRAARRERAEDLLRIAAIAAE